MASVRKYKMKHGKMPKESYINLYKERSLYKIYIILCKSDKELTESGDSLNESSIISKCDELFEIITVTLGAEVEVVTIEPSDVLIIKETLVSTWLHNKADIVFITGYTDPTESSYINDAIDYISIDRKDLSANLANMLTQIEEKLEEIMHYKTICGMRRNTLFINLSGMYEDKGKCFTAISNILVNMMNLIRKTKQNKQKTDEDSSSSDEDSSSSDEDSSASTLSSDHNFSQQEKDENIIENLEKPFTSSHSQLTDNTNDNENIHEKFPLIDMQNALTILDEVVVKDVKQKSVFSESVKISDAYGRILYENVYSNCNVPSFRTSSKHGYAVLVKDGKGLRKVQEGGNEFPPLPLQPGTCVWVKSGAPVPEGAVAVVQIKDTRPLEGSLDDKYIEIMIEPQHGQNIKTVGYDVMKGKLIVNKFTRIGPEEIGLLAISGCKKVEVTKLLSIGVLSIGDNLEEPGHPLKEKFVYDINRISLISILKHNGYSSLDFGIVKNKVLFIKNKVKEVLTKVDILVITGSVNDKHSLKYFLIHHFNATIHFGNVDVKPGRSTTLASCKVNDKMKYFLCLLGNTSSVFVAAHLFLLPFVNKMHANISPESAIVPVQTEASFLLHYRPRLAWTCVQWSNKETFATASSISNLYKNRLCSIAGSNALLILPQKKQKMELLPKSANNVPALLVDYPKNFNRLLPY